MKKYVKPELFFENYELSQHIAACDWDLDITTLLSKESCAFKGEGWEKSIFMTKDVCDNTDNWQEYCYHNSEGSSTIFNS